MPVLILHQTVHGESSRPGLYLSGRVDTGHVRGCFLRHTKLPRLCITDGSRLKCPDTDNIGNANKKHEHREQANDRQQDGPFCVVFGIDFMLLVCD